VLIAIAAAVALWKYKIDIMKVIGACAAGGGVSNSVVDALQARGLKARFIDGGIEGWKAAGGEVVAK
jgi:rhodanese-related sulfurtransferase